jgi:hypothetical protein
MRRNRIRLAAIVTIAALLAGYAIFVHTPPGPRSLREFDPDRVADLEVGMWQAYYTKENMRLFTLLTVMLREQYRYTWARAATEGFYLARPAARFAVMTGGYDAVLPDLERAYAIAKDWTGARYDPGAVARAELAWWVARRDPATSSVDNVGRLIAESYAAFYEVPAERVASAGRLRAEAGDLRDQGGPLADWPRVTELLHRSYRDLHTALHGNASQPLSRDQ